VLHIAFVGDIVVEAGVAIVPAFVYIYSSILGGNAVIANAASTHLENSDTELHPKQSIAAAR
jgi:hypothetical protein